MIGEAEKAAIYTDIQGLASLKSDASQSDSSREIARQFESMLMQQVLKSMHDATVAMSPDPESESMGMYSDLFNHQMALVMSNPDQGVGASIQEYLKRADDSSRVSSMPAASSPAQESSLRVRPPLQAIHAQPSPEESKKFIDEIWDEASQAASQIGCSPEILVAQAALETGWGKNVLSDDQGKSTNNLFNIKAGSVYAHGTLKNVIEEKDGVLFKQAARFREYESFKDSIKDYAHLLINNNRYRDALRVASDPEKFIQAVHKAGFATDHHYAEKVMSIVKSPLFKRIISHLQAARGGGT